MEIKNQYLRALHSRAPGAVGWITTFIAVGITLKIDERVAVDMIHLWFIQLDAQLMRNGQSLCWHHKGT